MLADRFCHPGLDPGSSLLRASSVGTAAGRDGKFSGHARGRHPERDTTAASSEINEVRRLLRPRMDLRHPIPTAGLEVAWPWERTGRSRWQSN